MKKNKNSMHWIAGAVVLSLLLLQACAPKIQEKSVREDMPEQFTFHQDTLNSASILWKDYYRDPYLIKLIDSALMNNQELNIVMNEINIMKNEVKARKGEYLPSVGVGAGAGLDKSGRYTRIGVLEHSHEIEEGKEFPEPYTDYNAGLYASWEIDIWKKLRNAKKSAMYRYLGSIEGKNFLVTTLVAEISSSYYELLALDNRLIYLNQNAEILRQAIQIVKLEKQSARVTELAVQKFEAELLKVKSEQFDVKQMIVEKENEINFLVGRFPQPVERDASIFNQVLFDSLSTGIPSQLLDNRPDLRRASLEMEAAKLDIKVAKARFYPSLGLNAGLGFQSYSSGNFLMTPESMIFSLAGDLSAPLLNRNSIKASYLNASSRQIQTVFDYEKTLLDAYLEVATEYAKIQNLNSSLELKEQQVAVLNKSVRISTVLFRSARADYMEVLMTQRDALDSKLELVETKEAQLKAYIHMYRALGGGWER